MDKEICKCKEKEFPDDERYKSISTFYCEIIEKVLEIFEKGKSLEDLSELINRDVELYWKDLETNVVIPRYNSSIETHRYTGFNLDNMMRYLIALRDYYTKNQDKNADLFEIIEKKFNQAMNKIHSKSITDYLNLEFFKVKNDVINKAVFEFKGKQKNVHYEACKSDAMVIGMIGGKITDCIYSNHDFYIRFDLVSTDLLFNDNIMLQERKNLMHENLDYLINYSRIIKDKDYYFWMKLADDGDVSINFKNKNTFSRWIEKVENDLNKYDIAEDFLLNILRFFERIHWIRIIDEGSLSFKIELAKDNFKSNYKYMLDYLLKNSRIIQNGEEFRLDK